MDTFTAGTEMDTFTAGRDEMDTITAGMRWTPSQQGQEMETFTTRIGDGHLHNRDKELFSSFLPQTQIHTPVNYEGGIRAKHNSCHTKI